VTNGSRGTSPPGPAMWRRIGSMISAPTRRGRVAAAFTTSSL